LIAAGKQVLLIAALCTAACFAEKAQALAVPLYFDFGNAGTYIMEGYTGVGPRDTYNTTRHYGWSARVAAADRPSSGWDYLLRDAHTTSDATFRTELNAGTYNVRVWLSNGLGTGGYEYTYDNVEVTIEGCDAVFYSSLPPGEITYTDCETGDPGADGILDIRIRDTGGGQNLTCMTNGVEITAGATSQSITGTVYTDEGSTVLANALVGVSVNGGAVSGQDTTDAGGQYTLDAGTLTGGSIVTLFLKGATVPAMTVTRGSGSSMTGVHLYQNRLILRSNTGSDANAPPLTTAHLAIADNATETGITLLYNVRSNVLTMNAGELLIWTGSTFRPGKYVELYDLDINGTLSLEAYTGSVIRNFDSAEGTFSGTGALSFTNIGTGGTITTTGDSLPTVSFGGVQDIDRNGLIVWLDADDSSTLRLSGTGVVMWYDKSGKGNHARPPTNSLYQPDIRVGGGSGRTVINFDANDGMNIDETISAAPYTIYIVYNTTSLGGTRRAIQGSANWFIGFGSPYDGWHSHYANGWVASQGENPASNGEFAIAGATNNGSASAFYVNATNETDNSSYVGTPESLCLGGSTGNGVCGAYNEPLVGDIAEIIIYNRVLTGNELTTLECYLSSKWDIDVSASCAGVSQTTMSGTYTLGSALDLNGDLIIEDQSILDVSASNYGITLSGSWINKSGTGGFVKRSGTVELDGGSQTLSGFTLFHTLSKTTSTPKTLTFDPNGMVTVSGALILRGTVDNLLSIRSQADGSAARLVLDPDGSQTIDYVNVKDSDASGGQELDALPGGINGGNTTHWFFGAVSTVKQHFFHLFGF